MRSRVPFVPQMQPADCGAACLVSVARHFGRFTDLREARRSCRVGRDGTSARNIVEAAREMGFDSHGAAVPVDRLHALEMPVVAHMRDLHFVVVERVRDHYLDVMDPALGRRRVRMRDFAEAYSGTVLQFDPDPDRFVVDEHRRSRMPSLRHLYRELFRTVRWSVLVAIVITGALQTVALITPFVTASMTRARPLSTAALLQIVAACGFVFIGASALRGVLLLRLKLRHDDVITSALLNSLVRLPLEFFQSRSSADLLSRVSSTASVRDTITAAAITTIVDAGAALAGIVALGFASPALQLSALAIATVVFVTPLLCYRYSRQHALTQLEKRSSATGRLVMLLLGIEQAKAHSAEDTFVSSWRDVYTEELDASRRIGRIEVVLQTVVDAVRVLAAPVLILVAFLTLDDVGTAISLGLASIGFLLPVIGLARSLVGMLALQAHFHRVEDVLGEPAAPERGTPTGGGPVAVHVIDTTYAYPGARVPAVQGASVSIEPGATVLFAGVSGSGKSTLARLVAGLLTPSAGEIRLTRDNGLVVARTGYVAQSVALFPGTLESNILFGRTATDEELERAIWAADLDEFVDGLDRGVKTMVVDGGQAFSGGQRQRIAIARALLGDPSLIIMDEATSNIDPESELRVLSRVAEFDATKILITHRPHVIQGAEHIVFLDRGRVVAQGTHDELLDGRAPAYAAFWQASRRTPNDRPLPASLV